ncbi:DUF6541 family protein, partial [Propionibacterium freudenreichii]|uniref:DUF6541 family protein n=1 Tax=Propionibacterium freudenreichii TaxID=1744 RepID=UPI00254D3CB9
MLLRRLDIALPLAAIGANSIGAWLLRFAHLRVPANVVASPRLEATLKWATTLVLALVLMLVTQLPATYRQALRAASDIYRITPDANVIDPDEYALLKQLPQLVPAGQRWCHSVEATLPVGGGLIGGVCGWRGWGCRSVTGRRSRRPRKR